MKANPVVWFEIYVQDMYRAKTFYESVFQITLNQLQAPNIEGSPIVEMLAFPGAQESYGAMGALVKMDGCPSGGSTLVYFACEDCSIEAARAAENGGKIFKEKMPIGEYGHIALIYDTEGNMIGLHSMS